MGLKRVGLLLFAVGLLVASVAAAVFGVTAGCTEVACGDDFQPSYSVERVDFSTGTVYIYDGCNTCELSPFVLGGSLAMLLGLPIGLVGIARDELKWEP